VVIVAPVIILHQLSAVSFEQAAISGQLSVPGLSLMTHHSSPITGYCLSTLDLGPWTLDWFYLTHHLSLVTVS